MQFWWKTHSCGLPLPSGAKEKRNLSTFVLIHGAWHGAWVWNAVAPLLRQNGHTVYTPDLPGHGKDTTPVSQVTLQGYVDRVSETLDRCAEPAVLVGHSMGGIVISQTAEQRPDRVSCLVYLCAFLLPNGQCLLQWAEPDKDALVLPNLMLSEDKTSCTLKAEAILQAFYGDCSRQEVEALENLLGPQATAPFATPVRLSPEGFGRIPRVYIECTQDRAISLGIQRGMCAASGCDQIYTLNASHSPFLSMPREVTDLLLRASQVKRAA